MAVDSQLAPIKSCRSLTSGLTGLACFTVWLSGFDGWSCLFIGLKSHLRWKIRPFSILPYLLARSLVKQTLSLKAFLLFKTLNKLLLLYFNDPSSSTLNIDLFVSLSFMVTRETFGQGCSLGISSIPRVTQLCIPYNPGQPCFFNPEELPIFSASSNTSSVGEISHEPRVAYH